MNPFSKRSFILIACGLVLLARSACAAPVTANFTSAATVPVTAASYVASGNSVDISLGFVPPTGTILTVVNNTGADFIGGRFTNLAQGQVITLTYNGATYQFVANYHGGTGNDLVLQWAVRRIYAWGNNARGEYGNGTTTSSTVPVAVPLAGTLSGKLITTMARGSEHTLALCSDGTLAAWGSNAYGQLGNGSITDSNLPLAVTTSGVLAGKSVIAIAAGTNHSLALCSDGTLTCWGSGFGNTPAAFSNPGVLAGNTVTAISAGGDFSLALSADGTVAAWGNNASGQLGNGTTSSSGTVPVGVTTSGILAGKTVTAISAGFSHSLVLCSDGSLVAWGNNSYGGLGNGNTINSAVPVPVNTTSILAGRSVTRIAAGINYSLALCLDGTLASWGGNGAGQLGNGTFTNSNVPVAVIKAMIPAGQSIASITADRCGFALSADGLLWSWGDNLYGQLGNDFTYLSTMPFPVSTAMLQPGERFTALAAGSTARHAIAMAAIPLSNNSGMSALAVNPDTMEPAFSRDITAYTMRVAHGTTSVTVTPTVGDVTAAVTVNGVAAVSGVPVAVPISPGHRTLTVEVAAQNGTSTAYLVNVRDDSTLAGLSVTGGTLSPAFSTPVTGYDTCVATSATSVRVTPVATDGAASIKVNGTTVASGSASPPVNLAVGTHAITVTVTALDGAATSYRISVLRPGPFTFTYNSADAVPPASPGYIATDNNASFSLGFAPATGTNLMVLNRTGNQPYHDRFANLVQGQVVTLAFNNVNYRFVANYYGGTGNDLVLQWAMNMMYGWGANGSGQLGNGFPVNATVPTAVISSGVLANKTITAVAKGQSHSLALCADGTLAAWGSNASGQLGNGTTTNCLLPVAVTTSGVLAGKTIIAIAAGADSNLALCEDGTLTAWGSNAYGQLGDGTAYSRTTPVAVFTAGALAGKTVTAIAAGASHNLALCSDGTLVAWGKNTNGQLGNGTTFSSVAPFAVATNGFLAGKTVTVIAAGNTHSIALCADGSVAAWGNNGNNNLGDGTTISSNVPVAVTTQGVLAGKTVTVISAGGSHNLALCSDGTLTAWGSNTYGQLGTNSSNGLPVAVTTSGILYGRIVTAMTAGSSHSHSLCSDGVLCAWGSNASGQLGNGTTTDSGVPVAVSTSLLGSGVKFTALATGISDHTIALAAVPVSNNSDLANLSLSPGFLTMPFAPATGNYNARVPHGTTAVTVTPVTADANATVTVNGITVVSGATGPAIPISPGNMTATINVISQDGANTTAYVVTIGDDATLSGLLPGAGTLVPAFATGTTSYVDYVSTSTSTVTVTPIATDGSAAITVNGISVASGDTSGQVNLAMGANPVSVRVTALDGTATTYQISFIRQTPVTYTYNSAAAVPVTAADYTAAGNTVNFTLNFAPQVGTSLTVVNNTGLSPIHGVFDNLSQGQVVNLTYGGLAYPFVANYYGGTGNDLVLEWANNRIVSWGYNYNGQLGNSSSTNSSVAVPVDRTGVLAGKTVTSVATGSSHSLALCSDGTLAAWGGNTYHQLGINGIAESHVPVLVDRGGVLAGKTVVAIAAGVYHSLALCADGTLAAWGYNDSGQLGTSATGSTGLLPVLVDRTGVLAGKSVVAITAGGWHSLALCTDGTLVAWGSNSYGQLGNNNNTASGPTPVLVDLTGVLAGKSVTAIAAGNNQSTALCSDGTLAAWGYDNYGQLGNNSTTNSGVPVLVQRTGVLAGKTVTAVGSGSSHGLALCSDGTLSAWGYNYSGQLGNNSVIDSKIPVMVNQTGVLAGKTVAAIRAVGNSNLTYCADGTLAAWGDNGSGQLGNGSTTNSSVPVSVTTSMLSVGERFVRIASGTGSGHNLAIVAMPLAPIAATLAAAATTDTGTTLNASVNAQGTATAVSFEYGLTSAYGMTVAATPASVSGTVATSVTATLGALLAGTTYHYRVVATNASGTAKGADMTFTTTTAATLFGLALSDGALYPALADNITGYVASVSNSTASVSVTPLCLNTNAVMTVNGGVTPSGTASAPLALAVGNNTINIVVTTGGSNTRSYVLTVTRLPQTFTYNSGADVPVTASDFAATGKSVALVLNHTPMPGVNLSVVNNTGPNPIQGTFDNLTQWQLVPLTFSGVTYSYMANYRGGTGNDLILQWANTRVAAWGANSYGQLGINSTVNSNVPVPVDMSGILAGKSVVSFGTGYNFSMALCSDGTLATWGANGNGQLGSGVPADTMVPGPVDQTGVLAGRRVVAIASGDYHCLALCEDGTLAAWGYNLYGQLGNNSKTDSDVPVLVDRTGVLAGKTVIAIAAAGSDSLALCSDGTLAAWGYNGDGQLGNNSTTLSTVPVAVDLTGVLAGKRIIAAATGGNYCLALCADGSLAAWGANTYGKLGNNSSTSSSVPVAVTQSGVLAGKTVIAISSGNSHSLALCQDGTVAAWGAGTSGQLGNGATSDSSVPVMVSQTGALAGRTVAAINAGAGHSLALCPDGTLAAWGSNSDNRLGTGGSSGSSTPVAVHAGILMTAERFTAPIRGYAQDLALIATPPAATATTLVASSVLDTRATLNGSVTANGTTTAVAFEYGLTSAYGMTATATPTSVTGTTVTSASATLTGLRPGTTYHCRIIVRNNGAGGDMTFTTSTTSTLSGLGVSDGTLSPGFDPSLTDYLVTVPNAVSAMVFTPVAADAATTVTVNGVAVASGTASAPVSLGVGNNTINVVASGADTLTYKLTVTRLPQTFTYNTAADIPVTAERFTATGSMPALALNFAPVTGVDLTVVKNTGSEDIRGLFGNLSQGQIVQLSYGGMVYAFAANYHGGTGNDLTLQWANTRLMTWGGSSYGASIPGPVAMGGALSGKTVGTISTGGSHFLALFWDGSIVAWGSNESGQLGDNSTTSRTAPIAVDQTGWLAGKNVTMAAAGGGFSAALCQDGTVAAWGYNGNANLGDNSRTFRYAPVGVFQAGVLAGRKVVAIDAGSGHTLALCADGALVAWGTGYNGQYGNNTSETSAVPVLTDRTGVLAGKTITAIAAGYDHSLVLCSDGTMASWGNNSNGQLGNNNTTNSLVPVAVTQSGVLSGKSVTAIAAGSQFSQVLCTDGTLAAWGYNSSGQLGNGSTTNSSVPVLVSRSGVLSGKTVTAISAGSSHCMALCTDGTLAAWGYNNDGELGDNTTTNRTTPMTVNTQWMRSGERFVAVQSGGGFTLAQVASPPAALAQTMPATAILDTGSTLNGSVNANATAATITMEYGLTATYGEVVVATPASATGTTATAVSCVLGGLRSGTTYHYRVVATGANGTTVGNDMTFTTTSQANLNGLTLSDGALTPAFDGSVSKYLVTVPNGVDALAVTPTVADPSATVTVNGLVVASGSASAPVPLATGESLITINVTSADGLRTHSYLARVVRLPLTFAFNSAADVPVTADGFAAGGQAAQAALGFAPVPGTCLTMVRNTGTQPIQGTFANLPQGGLVNLTYNGASYVFVANYFGGSGNDLVLQWANSRLMAWGRNLSGQLGDGTTNNSSVPVACRMTGALAGRTVTSVVAGDNHCLALCGDGTIAAWGDNYYGQLGAGSTYNGSPPAVDGTGVLASRTVIAVVAGGMHSLALCADGTVAAWGYNAYGQLGNHSTANANAPVQVWQAGVLTGRTVVALAAGNYHSLALCADGSVAAWGSNTYGQLGNPSAASSNVPVMVDRSGVLAGKTVVAIAAGRNLSLALCSDGTLAAWGMNSYGQLGNNTTSDSNVPVQVMQTGVLAGKTVTAIATCNMHCLALCSDGTAAAWGIGVLGGLGNGGISDSRVPVLVNRTGVLASRTVAALTAGSGHSAGLCSDGAIATWGGNSYGQLGNNSTSDSSLPVLVNTGALGVSERFFAADSGNDFILAMVAMLPPPAVTTQPATSITDNTAVLNGSVTVNGGSAVVTIEYGLTTAYVNRVTGSPSPVAGITTSNVSATLGGLTAGTGYHYRIVANQGGVVVTGGDMTFTTDTGTLLADMTFSEGIMAPAFAPGATDYALSVPSSVASVRVTPVAAKSGATITVNGTTVDSGAASGPVDLPTGGTPVTIVVTSTGGDKQTYRVTAVRLPAAFVFSAATDVPLTVNDLVAAGNTVSYALNFAPAAGTVLMMVKNTGGNFIRGSFDNLPQGQRVQMTYAGNTYNFIANYYGGNGNDLVLQWADCRILAWGGNASGQLGNNGTTASSVPQPVDMTGVLANKSVVTIVSGDSHTLALCVDGTLAAWGDNTYGQLGNGGTTRSGVPVAVDQSGVLAGKRVVAISSRSVHNLALCSDGSVAAWGSNGWGKLGNGTSVNSSVPVLVNTSGVLAGRKVTAIAAGADFSLFLCADGTLAACGFNGSGQLGNNSTTSSTVPVLVDRSGVLAVRTVTSIAAGISHSLAMCADGILVSWGNGSNGQLGNNTISGSMVPGLVDQSGALLTKAVTAIACGTNHNLALCGDGSLAAWGSNSAGQLGNLSASNLSTPLIINPVGVLAGRFLAAAAGGGSHSLAFGADGILAAWGSNANGQLGNGVTMNSSVPVWVNNGSLYGGERPMVLSAGSSHSLMMTAMAVPSVIPLPASAVTTSGAMLNCQVNANGNATTVSFEYGATTDYGNTLAGSPATVSGSTSTVVRATLGGSVPGTVCHYRVVAANRVGIVRSADLWFVTPSDNTRLTSLSLGAGTLTPAFDPTGSAFLTTVPHAVAVMRVTPVPEQPGAEVRINGMPVSSGTASDEIPLAVGDTAIMVEVTAEDGINMRNYAISVTRLPMKCIFGSATDVPLTCDGLDACGLTIQLGLNHAPAPDTVLTAIDNTGSDPIRGVFSNLNQGQRVTLDYRGVHYDFGADYAGGTGNDLVLQLLDVRPYDVDLDGIEDLVEYAFGIDPVSNRPNPPPRPVMAGDLLVIRFTEPEGGTGLTYGAQWSGTLQPGSWTDIPDTGSGTEHIFSVPRNTSPNLFMRLKVTGP